VAQYARAGLLEADTLVNEIALDRYSFIRDAYLQQRRNRINRGAAQDALPDYEDDWNDDDVQNDSN